MKLHHHGIVVRDLLVGRSLYEALGARLVGELYDDPIQQAQICFLQFPGSPALVELIAPYSSEATVAGYLQKNGGGLHHVCYMVEDLEAAMERFRANKSLPVFGPKPAVAFQGHSIAFMYLRDRSLIELVEAHPDIDPVSLLGGVG